MWILASAIPLAVTFVMLWSPPPTLEGVAVIVWVGVALILFGTTSTAFYIPYSALGMEMTLDYHERTRLFGWRQMLSTMGFAASLAILCLIRTAEDDRPIVFMTVATTGVIVATVIILCARWSPESRAHQGRGANKLVAAFRDVL